MKGLAALLRIELRDARRHPRRTALVVALVALATAGIVAAGALVDAAAPSTDAAARDVLGHAALRVDGVLPPGVDLGPRGETHSAGETTITHDDRELRTRFVDLRTRRALGAGLVDVSDGRLPRAIDELALSADLAGLLDVAPGATVRLGDDVATIVGTLRARGRPPSPLVVRAADGDAPRGEPFHLVDAPDAPRVAAALAAFGVPVTRRADLVAEPDAFESLVVLGVGAFAAFEVALLLVAAFAVGAPRRRRALGVVAATGARPGVQLVASTLAAAGLALAGAALGVGLGLVTARAVAPLVEASGLSLAALETPWLHVVGGPALALLAVLVAVAGPIRRDLRLPIVAQLAARRPGPNVPPRRRVAVTALAVGGLCAVLASARGPVLLAPVGAAAWGLAAVLAVPWLLDAAARRAEGLPPAWRLAVRDAGRLAGRTAPVVVGVLAVASVALQLVVLVVSVTAAHGGPARDQALLVGPGAAGLVHRALERDEVVAAAALRAATRHGRPVEADVDARRGWIAVGDATLVEALGVDPADDTPLVLIDGVADTATVRAGDTTFTARRATPRSPDAPLVVVSPEFAAARRWTPAPPPGRALTPWLVRFARPADVDTLRAAHGSTDARIETSPGALDAGPRAALLAVLVATALAVVACIAGLDASESARDATILSHLGAAPTFAARVASARAAWVALVGCALAVPATIVPVVAWTTLADVRLPVSIPWAPVALLLLGLPLLTGLGMRVVAAARTIV